MVQSLIQWLIVIQMVKKFRTFMEPEGLPPYSQKFTIGPDLKPLESSQHHHTLFLKDTF
jgi:hypothetical protein